MLSILWNTRGYFFWLLHFPYGQNFGVVFCGWDWVFGAAFLPPGRSQPEKPGFENMSKFPRRLLPRLVYPLFASE